MSNQASIQGKASNMQPLKPAGFTIIEIMIVLAIAALILLIMFLAVPNFQRQHRNFERRGYARLVLSALLDFRTYEGGRLPTCIPIGEPGCSTAANLSKKFITDYLPPSAVDDFTSSSVTETNTSFCHGDVNDKQTVIYCWYDSAGNYILHTYVPSVGQLYIVAGHKCGTNTGGGDYGDQVINDYRDATQSFRIGDAVAVVIGIEGGSGYYCVSG